jgi:hypothetical protein
MTNHNARTGAIYSAIALVVNCTLMIIYEELSVCWFSKRQYVSAMCSDSLFEFLLFTLFLFWMDFLLRSVILYFVSEGIFRSLSAKLHHQNTWVIDICVGIWALILAILFSAATLKLTLGFVPYSESNDPVSIFFIFQQKSIDPIILFFIPVLTYFIASPFLFRDIRRKIKLEFDNVPSSS